MVLSNFIFITVNSFDCFGLPWLPTVGGHFWPFTGVLREIGPAVTRKVQRSSCCRGRCARCEETSSPKCPRPAFATLRRGKPDCHDSCYISRISSAAAMIWAEKLPKVQFCFSSQSFWKAGSERNGSQRGSSLRSARVTGAALVKPLAEL